MIFPDPIFSDWRVERWSTEWAGKNIAIFAEKGYLRIYRYIKEAKSSNFGSFLRKSGIENRGFDGISIFFYFIKFLKTYSFELHMIASCDSRDIYASARIIEVLLTYLLRCVFSVFLLYY